MTLTEFKAWYWKNFSNPANLTEENVSCLKLSRDYLKRNFSLYPYQVPAAFAMSNFNQVFYTDDMGLGKTPTTIAALSDMYARGHKKFIICVLFATVGQWESSIAAFSTFNVLRVRGNKQQRYKMYQDFLQDEDEDILLVSYNTLSTDAEVISKLRYSTVIFDEADYFKSPTSAVFRAVSLVRYKASKCILISGTPVSGRLDDSFDFIEILTNKAISYYKLRDLFCEMTEIKTPIFDKRTGRRRDIRVKIIKKYRNISKFRELFEQFTFGRSIEQTGTKMPNLEVSFVFLNKTQTLSRYEKLILAGTFVKSKEEKIKLNGLQKVSYLQRGFHSLKMLYPDSTVENPKIDELYRLLEELKDEQVAIFCNYKQIPSEIKDYLEANGGLAMVTGDVTGNTRLNQLKEFVTGKRKYLILTLAGYAGVSLPNCRHLICLDTIYNAAKMRQIQRRICRKDSVYDDVEVTYVMYRESIDTLTWQLLQRRGNVIDFMNSPEEADEELLASLEKTNGIGISKLKK